MDSDAELRPRPRWGEPHEIGRSNDGEDDFVIDYYKNKTANRQRLVVDIGAADGLTGSNSRRLIKEHGWRAILVEPFLPFNEFLNQIYENNDNVKIHNFACDFEEKQKKLFSKHDESQPGFTSLVLEWENFQEVQTKRFDKIIDVFEIDFLSLDTEGKDFDILKTIDFEKYKIEIICVEKVNDHYNLEMRKFLENLGYELSSGTNCNFIFIKK